MSKQAVIALLIVVLSAGTAFLLIKSRKPAEPRPVESAPPMVEFVEAHPSTMPIPVETQGTVTAGEETEISAEVAGRVVWISPDLVAGGQFKPGQVLMRLDDSDYRLALQQAQARLEQARVQLAQVQVESNQAKQEWKSFSNDPAPPLVAREPYVQQAEATVDAARADVERAQLGIQRAQIKAPPYSGRVEGVAVGLGQLVSPGRPVAKVFRGMAVQLRLQFTQQQADLIGLPPPGTEIEQSPQVTLTTLVGGTSRDWKAELLRTEATMDPRTRMIVAVAKVDENAQNLLSVGQFVAARVLGKPRDGVVKLPRAALHGDDQIYLVNADKRLEIRTVNVILKQASDVLLDGGVQDGEKVLITPIEYPVNGELLNPVAAKS